MPSPAVAVRSEPAEVAEVSTASAYTPVATSVKAIHTRITNNALVLSSLARLQSLVPTSVSERAVSAAGQAQALSLQFASPIVQRVDTKLNSAIVGVRSLPAYGSAKVVQADELAYKFTPEQLKPTYVSAKELAVTTVKRGVAVTGSTVQRARAIKAERSQQLWSTLESVQTQVNTLRSALEKTGAQATEALHLHARLTEVHAKVQQALLVADEKRTQARHLVTEVLATVGELTEKLSQYLESNGVLSAAHRELVQHLWARLLEGINTLKTHVYSSAPPSPSASRSDSAASAAESVDAASGAASAAAAGVASSSADEESESKTVETTLKQRAQGKKAQQHSKPNAKQQQQQEEQKKIDAENE